MVKFLFSVFSLETHATLKITHILNIEDSVCFSDILLTQDK